MDRRSRSTESNYRSRRSYRRRSISRSRSKSRSRRYNRSRTRSWSRSRSRSREREFRRNRPHERDPYKESSSSRSNRYHHHHRSGSSNKGGGGGGGGVDNSYRGGGGVGGGGAGGGGGGRNREDNSGTRSYENKERTHNKKQQHYYSSPQRKDDHSDSYESDGHYYDQYTPNNTIIVRGLAQHITEADISCDLMQYNLVPLSIRLIRKRKTGTSRGFAFVEFSIKEEAMLWMQHKQGMLLLNDMLEPAKMQYSHSKEPIKEQKILSDWYCAKCGVFNFKRREVCFKCFASREESEKGGEGSDEISNILTKKIMLRNLDVLTNEECVLTIMQEKIPGLVEKITKILVCRDPLTQTSRGICYLYFDNLVDSMNTHNSLKALEPPLTIEEREVIVTYCMDTENKHIIKPSNTTSSSIDISSKLYSNQIVKQNTYQYTIADVPRLAEYSASMYASSQAEKEYYYKYYTNYYITEISKGQFTNLPTMNQLGGETSANSGAAVALSAIQRKMSKSKEHNSGGGSSSSGRHNNNSNKQAQTIIDNSIGFIPDKQYPPPDITSYQYDETSGYYYDPMTKLYYDSNSQYFYNNDTASYLYYDSEKQKYLAVPTATTTDDPNSGNAATSTSSATTTTTNDNKDNNKKHDKVKVAKKIVKDMEKWAKQLNQKKDMNFSAPTIVTASASSAKVITNSSTINLMNNNNNNINNSDTNTLRQLISNSNSGSGYADVCYSILENKDKLKLMDNIEPTTTTATSDVNRIVTMYNSDSDDNNHDDNNHHHSLLSQQGINNNTEKDYVDFEKLTCLICKRAFQSQDILNKHLKMSKLHKENLQKYNLNKLSSSDNKYNDKAKLEYRDRAKERRLKYGECDPPPINRSKERFEKQLESVSTVVQSNLITQMPISENNVGNRLLQKMGWQEGQGLGKKNQGRTNIVETDGRNSSAGLGAKVSSFGPGDDYKSYIKRMMKSRYDQS